MCGGRREGPGSGDGESEAHACWLLRYPTGSCHDKHSHQRILPLPRRWERGPAQRLVPPIAVLLLPAPLRSCRRMVAKRMRALVPGPVSTFAGLGSHDFGRRGGRKDKVRAPPVSAATCHSTVLFGNYFVPTVALAAQYVLRSLDGHAIGPAKRPPLDRASRTSRPVRELSDSALPTRQTPHLVGPVSS